MKQGTLPVVVGGVVIGGLAGVAVSFSNYGRPEKCQLFPPGWWDASEAQMEANRAACLPVHLLYGGVGAFLVAVGAWYVAEKL